MENRVIENSGSGSILRFAPLQSLIDEGFWHRLSSLKLNHWRTDESAVPITGFFAPCSHSRVSNPVTLLSESLPYETSEKSASTESSHPNRNRCAVPGTLYNTNTTEGFHALLKQRQSLLKAEAEKIWADIHDGKAENDSALLLRFLLISFADLKKWSFNYCVAFPALVLDPPAILADLKPASEWLTLEEAESLSAACNEWRRSSTTAGVPFFIVTITSSSRATIRHLSELESCQQDSEKILFGFYDPCHLPNHPGWPLFNFLAFICSRWNLTTVRFFCYRENRGFADMGLSLVGEALISVSQEWKDCSRVPNAVGWELDRGKKLSRSVNLATSMDPTRLAESAADLNLKLMRWRALPSLDIGLLSSTRCLLLGAGTLGCQVARMLMAWGVRNITLLDNGRVAMSNPLRQSLYTLDDCLNGGENKALAAARSLKRIFPAVDAKGVVMAIPMPGHPVPTHENVLEECIKLQELVNSHDVVFLLTDTRESRWLPTLLCASTNKVTINAALGFESFLVMRHGAGLASSSRETANALSLDVVNLSLGDKNNGQRLGCYFCNDVVAPIDSTANRTLDQQCTVTRPGLAPIASALAVELAVGLLHHPLGIYAPAETAGSSGSGSSEQPLGILPHQIRGSLSQFSQMTLVGHASNSCTACSRIVVSEFQKNQWGFVMEAINHPTFLEDLTGLTDLMKSANTFELDWDIEEDVDNDDDCAEI